MSDVINVLMSWIWGWKTLQNEFMWLVKERSELADTLLPFGIAGKQTLCYTFTCTKSKWSWSWVKHAIPLQCHYWCHERSDFWQHSQNLLLNGYCIWQNVSLWLFRVGSHHLQSTLTIFASLQEFSVWMNWRSVTLYLMICIFNTWKFEPIGIQGISLISGLILA